MVEENKKGYIGIHWVDKEGNQTLEKVQADSIGAYEDMPGFLVAYRDGSDVPIGFFNSAMIKSVRFLNV